MLRKIAKISVSVLRVMQNSFFLSNLSFQIEKQYKDPCEKVYQTVVCQKGKLGDKFVFP